MFTLAMEAKKRGMGVVGSTSNILDFIAIKVFMGKRGIHGLMLAPDHTSMIEVQGFKGKALFLPQTCQQNYNAPPFYRLLPPLRLLYRFGTLSPLWFRITIITFASSMCSTTTYVTVL
jgi:hypothetical protein